MNGGILHCNLFVKKIKAYKEARLCAYAQCSDPAHPHSRLNWLPNAEEIENFELSIAICL